MTAARLLALQANSVSLYEAKPVLGGQISQAALAAHDYGYFAAWLTRQMEKLKVDVHLGETLTAEELVNLQTDAIVIATGARGGYTYAANSDDVDTFDVLSAFDRDVAEWSGRVVIAGGDAESCYLAVRLGTARPDLQIDIVEPDSGFAMNKQAPARTLLVGQILALDNVYLHPESTVEAIGEGFVQVQRAGVPETWTGIRDVVVGGRVSNCDVYEELMQLDRNQEIYRIGDCIEPRDIHDATQEAAQIAELIRLRSGESARASARAGVS
jgi:pyruvate/2-oxoglutarate dehydrogenase complex dihydrolipoamide dehydrogenase (E3) component